MPNAAQQRGTPPSPPSGSTFWERALPWVVVYGLLLATLLFFWI